MAKKSTGLSSFLPFGKKKNFRKIAASYTAMRTPAVVDQYSAAALNIDYSIIDASSGKVIAVTSALPNEGKTVSAGNLARAFSQTYNKRTLLIDCDLHNPSINLFFNLKQRSGLTDVLAGKQTLKDSILRIVQDQVFILPGGTRVSNPLPLVASDQLYELLERLRKEFEIIILDTPPVLLKPDAAILARSVDGVVTVARSGQTKYRELDDALNELKNNGANNLGVILNDVPESSFGYGYG